MVAYEWAVENLGWRAVQQVMAGLCFTIAVPAAVFLRDNPESVGCTVDGRPSPPQTLYDEEQEREGLLSGDDEETEGSSAVKPEPARDFTRAEALRTRAMWLICMDTFFSTVFISGSMFHMILIVRENEGGEEVNVATQLMVPAAVAYGLQAIVAGWLIDRGVAPRLLLASAGVCAAVARCVLGAVNTPCAPTASRPSPYCKTERRWLLAGRWR